MDISKEKGIPNTYGPESSGDSGDGEAFERPAQGALARKLQGRHMQMIAIGTKINIITRHLLEPLTMSPLQVVPLAPVCSWAQAHLLSTVVPAAW